MKKDINYYMDLPYTIEVVPIPNSQGGGFIARLPEFGRLAITGDGESREEAIANLLAAQKERLSDYLRKGIKIPEPVQEEEYSGKFLLRTPAKLHMILSKQAQAEGISLNQYVKSTLEKAVVLQEHSRKDKDKEDRFLKAFQALLEKKFEQIELKMESKEDLSGLSPKKAELKSQTDEYPDLFELVPCIITVQDRNYKLVRYNHEFAERFDPKPGAYCFNAYKGLNEKCSNCPVEKTFEDGRSHWSEESGLNKDGTIAHWVVKTAPIKNHEGEIVAAMEMCLDITPVKQLKEKLEKSEKRYHAIFNNIPNPVFVLGLDTLEIFDCNNNVEPVYGYQRDEIIKGSFLDMFKNEDREEYASKLKTSAFISQAKQVTKEGRTLFVNIRISPLEYLGRTVLLVVTSDITKRLETEQQLIQASKMATLGEMATGVAHELNQPLSVIETASSFFMRKINKKERIEDENLFTMAKKIRSNVDRATKIIHHMREFGRKSDVTKRKTDTNKVLSKALEIFAQQLKLREIEVVKELQEDLPPILADSNRLEQVFINLLINARDAIEAKWEESDHKGGDKKIFLKTGSKDGMVIIEVKDTGIGIPQSIFDKIFEPFFTTKKVGRGTGLGLSISYGIIQDFGGSIHVLSNKNGGASFVIKLPVAGQE
ncbi:MAG: PAS domain S-box protein [Desulfobacterales bacterium]|nr:PAS domain S-box protein [Desulfobacterales bacterium]